MTNTALSVFKKLILNHPAISIIVMFLIGGAISTNIPKFQYDASSDALVLENDPALAYMRTITKRYGIQETVFITFTPEYDLFSDRAFNTIKGLLDELRDIDSVESINSYLDIPLLRSPPVPLSEMAENTRTLLDLDTDRTLARTELTTSPLYKDLLISRDGRTTAMQLNFKVDTKYRDFLETRNGLEDKKRRIGLTIDEQHQLKETRKQFDDYKIVSAKALHRDISRIRDVMKNYRNGAQLYLGGVPMIADDMMTYVRNDVATFGIGVAAFLLITLAIIFRQFRWVVIPLICCGFSSLVMVGLLGLLDWRVTVISSNFISLVLIITLALSIHLVVHYRELLSENSDWSNLELVIETVRHMFAPCFYTTITSMIAFSSLVVSQIVPVINFGWMMVMGIAVTFIVNFTLFPIIVLLLPKPKPMKTQRKHSLTALVFGRSTLVLGNRIFLITLLLLLFSLVGLSKLKVENSFIDYFDSSTEIYQGMSLIDKELGGTTPLEVIVKLGNTEEEESVSTEEDPDEAFFDDSDFGDDFEMETDSDPGKYWFTQGKVAKLHQIHDFIDGLSHTGKVLSISTMMRIAESFNENKALTNLELGLVYQKLPKEYLDIIVKPYVSFEENEARFSIRVKDSDPTLKRDELLKTIHQGLVEKLGLAEEDIHLSGMLVMYNNMLKSLFKSQILTLGVVLLAIFAMFTVIFRSLPLGIVGIIPNIISAMTILAIMGWAGIPLDMMTITIAAITVGIGVDDTIHYIHRFKIEIAKDYDYDAAVLRSHGSIGNAMYYTTITIILGFSILVLSNFVPTIYFGLLTGLAMFIALTADLTLLPQLLRFFKPFGKEQKNLN